MIEITKKKKQDAIRIADMKIGDTFIFNNKLYLVIEVESKRRYLNLETARVTDIPFGGYGVFPKADMSEVYIKTWTNNGTTNTITYKPIATEEQMEEEKNDLNVILNKIVEIENKIDSILSTNTKSAAAPAHSQQTTVLKKGVEF